MKCFLVKVGKKKALIISVVFLARNDKRAKIPKNLIRSQIEVIRRLIEMNQRTKKEAPLCLTSIRGPLGFANKTKAAHFSSEASREDQKVSRPSESLVRACRNKPRFD